MFECHEFPQKTNFFFLEKHVTIDHFKLSFSKFIMLSKIQLIFTCSSAAGILCRYGALNTWNHPKKASMRDDQGYDCDINIQIFIDFQCYQKLFDVQLWESNFPMMQHYGKSKVKSKFIFLF